MNSPPEAAPDPNYRVHREPPPADPKRIFNAPGIVLFIAALNLLVFGLMVLAPGKDCATLIEALGLPCLIPSQVYGKGLKPMAGFLRWVVSVNFSYVYTWRAHCISP